ncbi:hypothetical protein RDI58_009748 [Solanum bulbocastanum]|uniref:Uncharacterized protein n=1 Tax=Solanum bulbocastanum TaxID=147425 RepID=A0AAN8TSP8_SOLBU
MEIRYMIEDIVTPMEIGNQMGMRFFMELKRRQSNCGLYSLCIITTEKQNFGCTNNGEISFDQDTSMVEVGGDVGTVSVAALADNHSVNALCVLDSNSDHVICDCCHKVVKIKQLY